MNYLVLTSDEFSACKRGIVVTGEKRWINLKNIAKSIIKVEKGGVLYADTASGRDENEFILAPGATLYLGRPTNYNKEYFGSRFYWKRVKNIHSYPIWVNDDFDPRNHRKFNLVKKRSQLDMGRDLNMFVVQDHPNVKSNKWYCGKLPLISQEENKEA